MNKILARFVTRECKSRDGLIVGALFNDGGEYFKPYTVYQIEQDFIDDSLVIVEVGKSAITASGEPLNGTGVSWASDISHVIGIAGKNIILTREEWNELYGKD